MSTPIFTSTIGDATRVFTSIPALKFWLSNITDATIHTPKVYDHLGSLVEWHEDPWSTTGNVHVIYEGRKY